MSHFLLTGATGLLGGYLLSDLLDHGTPVACLVRRSANRNSQHRVDQLLRRFEASRGFSLPRPVVIEGDLNVANLGINDAARTWIAEHCSGVIHCAASLEFYKNTTTGEPYRTNVDSVRQLINFARQVGIKHFHHVSTAYVCGKRSGAILESELNAGQEFGNDYERSKFASESEVRSATGFMTTTIYRPSIIVGDSRSAYTSTFQGFYTPLQAGYALASRRQFRSTVGVPFLGQLGLDGNEGKNFVPVDWVSSVMAHIISQPKWHGRTYHLTNPVPTSTADIEAALTEAISSSASVSNVGRAGVGDRESQNTTSRSSEEELWFQDQMATYRNYLRDDPKFDCRNVLEAAPTMPCPVVDRAVMVKLAKWAIENRFGLPKPRITAPQLDVDQLVRSKFTERALSQRATDSAPGELLLGLCVTGSGGGTWTFAIRDNRVCSVVSGLDAKVDVLCRVSTQTLADLIASTRTLSEVMYAGRLLWEGRAAPKSVDEETKLFGWIAPLFESEMLVTESTRVHGRNVVPFASAEAR
ncbi:MAG: hypothetical protein C0483_10050 [Pirellula sp.]|nr:hypothetical protein [Pirellula sp.]